MCSLRTFSGGFALSILTFASACTAQPAAREIPVDAFVNWSASTSPEEAAYRSGRLDIRVRSAPAGDTEDLVHPVVTVTRAGSEPVRVEGADTRPDAEHRLTIGRWGNDLYLMFESYTGGAHCCDHVQVVYPEAGRLRVADLGEWNGGYREDLPADLDGDGRIDFVFSDEAFLYAFTSYADSVAPPLVLNIVDGAATEVSGRPAYSSLFAEAADTARALCLAREEDRSPNGACAAYVASSARLGRFQQAWAEMLRAYVPEEGRTYGGGCRVAPDASGRCPQGQEAPEYARYPEALRALLVERGYISG